MQALLNETDDNDEKQDHHEDEQEKHQNTKNNRLHDDDDANAHPVSASGANFESKPSGLKRRRRFGRRRRSEQRTFLSESTTAPTTTKTVADSTGYDARINRPNWNSKQTRIILVNHRIEKEIKMKMMSINTIQITTTTNIITPETMMMTREVTLIQSFPLLPRFARLTTFCEWRISRARKPAKISTDFRRTFVALSLRANSMSCSLGWQIDMSKR